VRVGGQAAGLALAVDDPGRESGGTSVLLVHGAATDRSLWRETVARLEGLRAITYDRRAYGDSEAPEPYGGTTVEEQSEDAAALLGALDAAPAVLCGQGLGALVCLDLLCRRPGLGRAAVLVEPPLWSLSPRGPEAAASLRVAIEAAARERGAAGAVDAYLVELAGPHAPERLGRERLERSHAAARAFAADLAAGPGWEFSRRGLAGVEVPVVVLAGRAAPGVGGEVAEALAALLPRADLSRPAGTGLLPVETPDAVAEAIRGVVA
jgi:pimeloyl-ACP methyl ester carboxylesterase